MEKHCLYFSVVSFGFLIILVVSIGEELKNSGGWVGGNILNYKFHGFTISLPLVHIWPA